MSAIYQILSRVFSKEEAENEQHEPLLPDDQTTYSKDLYNQIKEIHKLVEPETGNPELLKDNVFYVTGNTVSGFPQIQKTDKVSSNFFRFKVTCETVEPGYLLNFFHDADAIITKIEMDESKGIDALQSKVIQRTLEHANQKIANKYLSPYWSLISTNEDDASY